MSVSVDQMNRLVLDFLVVNGYSDVAAHFVAEAGMPPVDLAEIRRRRRVARLVRAGRIEAAIAQLNAAEPWYLDRQHDDHYELLQAQLIELIRAANDAGDLAALEPALEFAEKRMLPMIEQQSPEKAQAFLEQFQRVMGLVCFSANDLPAPLQALMAPARRASAAERINRALLSWSGRGSQAKLQSLLAVNSWAEEELARQNMTT